MCEELWHNVYRSMLEQENDSLDIVNKGVKEILFFDGKDPRKNRGDVDIRELLEHMYA